VPTLLILNPNTGQQTSDRLLALSQAMVGPGIRLRLATARFGARYISDEVSAAIAAHAALDAYAADTAAHGRPDAVLLACFGDPGLFALRDLAGVPVFGLAQAAMQQAALRGPFVVVTGGAAWVPMLQRLALALDVGDALLGVHALDATGGQIAGQGLAAVPALRHACAQALQRWPQARSVLLGGAGLAGLAEAVSAVQGVPVLDNWQLALQAAMQAALQATSQVAQPTLPVAHQNAGAGNDQPEAAAGWQGLGGDLQCLLQARAAPPQ